MGFRAHGGLAAFAFALLSCSGSSPVDATQDAGLDAGADASGSAHRQPTLPLVPFHGGHVMAHMKLVTITFAGYAYQNEVQAFGDWIVGSTWLASVGGEYGVGTGSHVAKLVLQYTPPPVMSARDIETYLSYGITSHVFPQPDADTLYVIYYPPATKPSGLGCDGPWWGHNTVTSPVRFAYAAIPACPPPSLFDWTQLESIEQDASHEIIEAATNPSTLSPSYEITDRDDPFFYMGTEIGDLCVGLTTREAGFTAQRIWSNAAAAGGRPPCVPAPPGDVIFGASPATNAALRIAPGGQATVTLTAWASGARGPWSIAAIAFPGYGATLTPTATLDRASIAEGDTAKLTVRVPAGATSGSRGIVVVDSLTVDANGVATSGPYEWPVLVEVP